MNALLNVKKYLLVMIDINRRLSLLITYIFFRTMKPIADYLENLDHMINYHIFS